MRLKLKSFLTSFFYSIGSVLVGLTCLPPVFADQTFSAIDSNQALQTWLKNNKEEDLRLCNDLTSAQSQQLLTLNPNWDAAAFSGAFNTLLLTCLYGPEKMNEAMCIGQATGCQPVPLWVPTRKQIQDAQGSESSSVTTASLNLNFYN